MPWTKAPPELVDRFERLTDPILAEPGVARRKMFGYPACFVDGHMFTGLHEDRWIVRLGPDDLDELEAAGGASFEPMPGRAMRGYLAMPSEMLADDPAVSSWLERALRHARSLPPKVKR